MPPTISDPQEMAGSLSQPFRRRRKISPRKHTGYTPLPSEPRALPLRAKPDTKGVVKYSLMTAALAFVVSNSALLAQEPPAAPAPAPAAPAPAPGAEGLARKVGSDCTIHFRNDIYATMGGSNLRMPGKLTAVTPEWIVLTTKDAEQWIPRQVVFTVEFPSNPAAAGH